MAATEPRRGRRASILALVVLLMVVAAGLLVALVLVLVQEIDCFDGAGGSPYTADDSPRAALCRTGGGVLGALIPVAWLVGLVLAVVVVRRWIRLRSGSVLLVAALALPLALPGLAFLGLTLPSAECTGDKETAYRTWSDGGGQGQAPYDCDTY